MNEQTQNDDLEVRAQLFAQRARAIDKLAVTEYNKGWNDGFTDGIEEGKRRMWISIARISALDEAEKRTNREDGVSYSDPLD